MNNFSDYAKDTNIVLNPEGDFYSVCDRAINLGARALFSPPCFLPLLLKQTKNTAVKAGALINYPFGFDLTSVRVYSAKQAELLGAQEIVVAVNSLAANDLSAMQNDIQTICQNVGIPVFALLNVNFFPTEIIIEALTRLAQTKLSNIVIILNDISALDSYISAAQNTNLKDIEIFIPETSASCIKKLSDIGVSSFWLNADDAFLLAEQG